MALGTFQTTRAEATLKLSRNYFTKRLSNRENPISTSGITSFSSSWGSFLCVRPQPKGRMIALDFHQKAHQEVLFYYFFKCLGGGILGCGIPFRVPAEGLVGLYVLP